MPLPKPATIGYTLQTCTLQYTLRLSAHIHPNTPAVPLPANMAAQATFAEAGAARPLWVSERQRQHQRPPPPAFCVTAGPSLQTPQHHAQHVSTRPSAHPHMSLHSIRTRTLAHSHTLPRPRPRPRALCTLCTDGCLPPANPLQPPRHPVCRTPWRASALFSSHRHACSRKQERVAGPRCHASVLLDATRPSLAEHKTKRPAS